MITALFPWLSLMGAGFIAGIFLLFWGFRSGQFSEQDKARYLPLRDSAPRITVEPGTVLPELYVLLTFMIGMGVLLAVTLGLIVFR